MQINSSLSWYLLAATKQLESDDNWTRQDQMRAGQTGSYVVRYENISRVCVGGKLSVAHIISPQKSPNNED